MKNAPRMLNGYILLKADENKDSAVFTGEDEEQQRGKVVAVSSKFIQNGTMFTIGNFDLKQGDKVIFLKHKGLDTDKQLKEQGYLMIHFLDIVAVENTSSMEPDQKISYQGKMP